MRLYFLRSVSRFSIFRIPLFLMGLGCGAVGLLLAPDPFGIWALVVAVFTIAVSLKG